MDINVDRFRAYRKDKERCTRIGVLLKSHLELSGVQRRDLEHRFSEITGYALSSSVTELSKLLRDKKRANSVALFM